MRLNFSLISSVQSSPPLAETTTSESKSDDVDVSKSTVTETSVVVTDESVVYFGELTTESIILSTIETFTLEKIVDSVGKYDYIL